MSNPVADILMDDWISYGAYGSNMNKQRLMERVSGEAVVLGTGLMHDWQLEFQRGVLNVRPSQGMVAPLAFWQISPQAREALDRYESLPYLYGVRMASCAEITPLDRGCSAEFLIYEMCRDAIYEVRPDFPGSAYFEICVQSYSSIPPGWFTADCQVKKLFFTTSE